MKKLWKEVKTVYTFADGKTETATFCLSMEPEDDKLNDSIFLARAEVDQRYWKRGAIKAKTSATFIER